MQCLLLHCGAREDGLSRRARGANGVGQMCTTEGSLKVTVSAVASPCKQMSTERIHTWTPRTLPFTQSHFLLLGAWKDPVHAASSARQCRTSNRSTRTWREREEHPAVSRQPPVSPLLMTTNHSLPAASPPQCDRLTSQSSGHLLPRKVPSISPV